MKRLWQTTIAATLVAIGAGPGSASAEVVDTRVLEESFPVPATEPLVVVVKNIIGSVRVTGHDRNTVEMRATETVRGDLQADIERARAEMELTTEQEPGRVAFRVRRSGEDGDCNCRWQRWDDDYSIAYDIELLVPRTATIDLATVSDGDVTVEGMHGSFTLANVNGTVRLVGARSSGSITTVNGDVEATFERAPANATSFKTVNGDLDVAFPAALSAQLAFASMGGDVYTDFDVEALNEPATVQRDGNRGLFTMRSNRNNAFRVGTGGARHSFNTLNGDIYVRKANQ